MTGPEDYCDPGAGVFTPGCTRHLPFVEQAGTGPGGHWTPLMPGGESTSARLARVEQQLRLARIEVEQRGSAINELAALYESATAETARVKRERAEAEAANDALRAELGDVRTELLHLREHQEIQSAGLASVRIELEQRRAERDKSYAANALLLDEMEALPRSGWVVARDGGRHCERCEQEVVRGQAYEDQPGTGGLLTHIYCPDLPEEEPMPATADDGPVLTPDDEIEIKATTVATRTFTVDRAEYEQALADDAVDDLFDVYVSDMDEQTTYTTPDGRVHAYPSGEVIGDESDGPF